MKIFFVLILFSFSIFAEDIPFFYSNTIDETPRPAIHEENSVKESYFELKASPITIDKVNKQRDGSYGANYNRKTTHDTLFVNYQRDYYSTTDPILLFTVSASNHKGEILYDYYTENGKWSYFILNTYKRRREGNIYVVKHEARAGLTGVKYTFLSNPTFTDLSLSFIPLYEYSVLGVEDQTNILNPILNEHIIRNIRNSFRFRVRVNLNNKLHLSNVLFYRPTYSLDKKKFDFKDVDFENVLGFDYDLGNNIFFTYQNIYSWDIRLKDIYSIPSTNMRNKFTFNWKLFF